jgi:hypothetical protein
LIPENIKQVNKLTMKKVYLTLAAAAFLSQANAQFWTYTTYKGAFPVTDGMTGTTSNDWTAGWTNWDPQNTAYGAPTVTVSTDITTNTTWTTGSIVLLQNKIYVKSGATLTIQPGVIIRGEQSSQGTLLITRGSKINAVGTQTNPIIFTSDQPVGMRDAGDWGGVVLLGAGITNAPGGVANIEGIAPSTDTEYGGSNSADNSGTMKYVRIEFPGIPFAPNQEINGLTFGAVGSGTTIDYIQVTYSGDDSYEWFGGSVNCKHLIAFRGLDDDFDTDNGFSGKVQFCLGIRDKDQFDAAGESNGFESDNDATGDNALPRTKAIFSNVTSIGPSRNGTVTLPGGSTFKRAAFIRRNSALNVFNSLAASWPLGVYIKDAATVDNIANDSSYYSHNVLASDIGQKAVKDANATTAFYATWFTTDANDSTTTNAGINWVNAFPAAMETTPDYRLNGASTVATGASFPTTVFTGGFLGIEDEATGVISNLGVYPNPANTYVNVVFTMENASNVSINVVDVTGNVVETVKNNFGAGLNRTNLNVSGLNNGVYFIQVTGAGINSTVKFVKN